MVMAGIGLIILGGTMCAVSGITFRPDPESEIYEKTVQDKGELTGFTYMIGAAFLQLGMLSVIFVIGLILVNELFPTRLRVTAGIMVILLCNLFFWVFILSGPVRMLNTLGGW